MVEIDPDYLLRAEKKRGPAERRGRVGRPKHVWAKRTYNVILHKYLYDWLMREAHIKNRSGASIIRDLIKAQMELDQGADMPPVSEDNQ
jgi:hypothetical protein